jgi:ketosteroid isomerase-like protein
MASPQELETIRRAYDAFNRRDIDGLTTTLDPDLEWHPLLGELGGGVYRGHDGVRRLVSEIDDTWESFRIELDEVIDAGDLVFVLSRSIGRGKASGVEAEVGLTTVWELRDGRPVRARSYATVEEALAAAGLERLPAAEDAVQHDRS